MRPPTVIALAGALSLTGCASQQRAETSDTQWSERVTLRAGESFVTDRRDVEVLLLGITPSGAMFAVRSGGYEQRVTMGPGEIGSRTFDRYRLELVSTTMGAGVELARHGHGMATIVITKWR